VQADGECDINAPTVYGAMHGMETFVQLLSRTHGSSPTVDAVSISDKPRFPLRATMIDTSRHYYPIDVILKHIDAMAAVKFNALHWHIVDSQSFPYTSTAFPELSAHGAFGPGLVYTPEDIASVITAAQVCEITRTHTTSLAHAHHGARNLSTCL
jgi:hexosaminidase